MRRTGLPMTSRPAIPWAILTISLLVTYPHQVEAQAASDARVTTAKPGTTLVAAVTAFGAPLNGLSAANQAAFFDGKAEFSAAEEPDEGLGPVFNGPSCAFCHVQGATGGAGTLVETRFGKLTNGVFDPLGSLGGSLIQTTGIGVSGRCNYVGETVPASATIRAGRLTTPLFGLGLINGVPSAALEAIALAQPSNVRGRTNRVLEVATGQTIVGKFGWKAQVPTVFQFAGDAYLNEMGITTPQFPTENCPQGDCSLLACDPLPEINGAVEDDGSGVVAFSNFMTFLAPPPTVPFNANSTLGAALFVTVGCANCHTPALATGTSSNPALNLKTFAPYSDFLLHDMGTLGDQIGGQGRATGNEMRTAPLWGARVRTRFLHDGRAANVTDATLAHTGQGKLSRDLFNALPSAQKAQIVAFINSI
ncbi:MAG: hypothetical protein RLZZ450_3789 [Pseudomonadota bacterium]